MALWQALVSCISSQKVDYQPREYLREKREKIEETQLVGRRWKSSEAITYKVHRTVLITGGCGFLIEISYLTPLSPTLDFL